MLDAQQNPHIRAFREVPASTFGASASVFFFPMVASSQQQRPLGAGLRGRSRGWEMTSGWNLRVVIGWKRKTPMETELRTIGDFFRVSHSQPWESWPSIQRWWAKFHALPQKQHGWVSWNGDPLVTLLVSVSIPQFGHLSFRLFGGTHAASPLQRNALRHT